MPFSKIQQKKLNALGQKVKDLRKERNLTLQQLAHSIGKDIQSIHRLEQGGVNPSYLYLLQICEGLEIEIADLLKGLEE
jgi:transcriptional regulator with XRE-family HTH domain